MATQPKDIATENVIFHEVQQFRQRWIWGLLLPTFLLVIILLGYGMVQQLVLGQPWGNKPLTNTALAVTGPLIILFEVGFVYLFWSLKLVTEVRDDGLYLRFYPLSHKKIGFPEIKSCEARTYRPIMEYGGWGIRYGRSGRAYSVCGNRGVQLVLVNKKRLLIGSQRPEGLAAAIGVKIG